MERRRTAITELVTARTASALATLAFQGCIKSGASARAKKLTGAVIVNLDEFCQKMAYNARSFSL
jgi:hypothetical protein